jgi:1,2-diacylglycerol 3-alpha-glucosyltransferase
MMTNTYLPHVGGVARSVTAFTENYRARGHRVLVVAPIFENAPRDEVDVVRIPALQRFNGSDFSVVLPVPGDLHARIREFAPDVIHSHHPFLLGTTAVRLARLSGVPLVFTHHTMYEQYTHYVPGDSPALKRFVIRLATGYANLCDLVLAPSESIAEVIASRGVKAPIEVVPTGVDTERFRAGDGAGFRARLGIPEGAFVVGHLGRLAPEKNLDFLARSVADFLAGPGGEGARFLLVGVGPSEGGVREAFRRRGLEGRLHLAGLLRGRELVDAYHAMDLFAFASQSETQGMVLTEAMAAGVPVVALDAPGVREVVRDGANGRLLADGDEAAFAAALGAVAGQTPEQREALRRGARTTAEAFSMKRSADKALRLYERLLGRRREVPDADYDAWDATLRLIRTEWEMLKDLADAAGAALKGGGGAP